MGIEAVADCLHCCLDWASKPGSMSSSLTEATGCVANLGQNLIVSDLGALHFD